MIDRFGEPMKVTRDVGLDVAAVRGRRASSRSGSTRRARRWRRWTAATRRRSRSWSDRRRPAGAAAGHAAAVLAGLGERLAATVRIDRGATLAGGHAGGLLAMLRARDALRNGPRCGSAWSAGSTAISTRETLEWLDDNEQLHSEGNIYGFCPGEGAGFCLMTRWTRREPGLPAAPRAGRRSPARARRTASRPRRSVSAWASAPPSAWPSRRRRDRIGPVDRILCDMNGERYRGNEYGFAVLRNSGRLPATPPTSRPRPIAGATSARRPGPLFVGLVDRGRGARLHQGTAVAALGEFRQRERAPPPLLRGPGRAADANAHRRQRPRPHLQGHCRPFDGDDP